MKDKLDPQVMVIAAIINERKRQDMRWGGPEKDDLHSIQDWVLYMDKFLYRIFRERDTPDNEKSRREDFIKIAALAVAAIESLDRKNGKTSPNTTLG